MTKKKVQNLLKHLVCILLCLTVILPFYMVVINSFKSKGEASRMSLALPKEWLFSNYTEVIDKGNLLQGFSNSLLYALVATTLGGCALCNGCLCNVPEAYQTECILILFRTLRTVFPGQLCNIW